MYSNFEDLNKAYGLNNDLKTRAEMNKSEEKAFVNDCYDTYEYLGFAETFETPYTDKEKYNGMKFTILDRVKELSVDKDGADLECLPMWNIQFENGDKMTAYPEEICLAERSR